MHYIVAAAGKTRGTVSCVVDGETFFIIKFLAFYECCIDDVVLCISILFRSHLAYYSTVSLRSACGQDFNPIPIQFESIPTCSS